MKKKPLILCLALLAVIGPIFAEAPVAIAAAKKARADIVRTALSYAGTPYVFGGSDASGFDCSGLVYRVYLQCVGTALPRTAKGQFDFREPIGIEKLQPGDLLFFNTTGPVAHVGIYEGDGRFIHAASDGPKTGVIESSLAESYWSNAFAGAGRIIPPAEYLGLIFNASLGPSLGTQAWVGGIHGSFEVAYRILGLETGIEVRPEYNSALGDFRLPVTLAVGIDRYLKVFAGPALTVGTPNLGGTRQYEASGGLLATVGLEYTPFRVHLAWADLGVTGELIYNRYVPVGAPADAGKDLAATVSAGLCLSVRWGM